MMEVTNVHLLRQDKSTSLTINFHHALSTVTMYDKAVFTRFLRNTLRVTTQQTIYIITSFVESFGDLLAVNDGDIDTFVKYTHSTNNARAAVKIILISNKVTKELKSMLF